MRRKKFGRMLTSALACALVCMLAFAMTAFAATTAEQSTGDTPVATGDFKSATITAKTCNKGDTLSLYKAVDVTFANNDVTYTFTSDFATFVTSTSNTSGITTIDEYMKAVKAEGSSQGNTAFVTLLSEFSAYARANSLKAANTGTTDSNGITTFTGVAQGQYVIVGTGNVSGEGTYVYETMTATVAPFVDSNKTWQTNTDFKLTMKTNTPTVVKTVPAKSDAGYSVGDTVSYEVSADVPVYSAGVSNKTFFIGDSMSSGLKLKTDSIAVYDQSGNVIPAADYAVTSTDTSFQVNLDYDKVVAAGATKVIVKYDATITDKAVTCTDAITNKATLTYTNNPFNGDTSTTAGQPGQGTSTSEAKVSTYGLEIKKQDKDSQTALAGATFALYTDQACNTPVKDAEGNAITITTNDSGYAAYSGLKKGTYYLKETVAPTGYKLLQDPVTITVSDTNMVSSTIYKTVTTYTTDITKAISKDQAKNSEGVLLWLAKDAAAGSTPKASDTQPDGYVPAYVADVTNTSSTTATDATAATGFTPQTVDNTKGTSLPTTGGMGTTVFYVLGGCIVAGAAIALVQRKRATTK